MNPAIQFLKRNHLDPETINTDRLMDIFAVEMEAGLSGRGSSLPMIPAYIPMDRPTPVNCSALVLDAGGTNLRAAVVAFDSSGKPQIEKIERTKMPGATELVSAEVFFNSLADFVAPLASDATDLGFCFSYPAEITASCDARLIQWTKQIQVPEVVGKMIGSGLDTALLQRGHALRFTVLNDTVATLMAGKHSGNGGAHTAYAGFILGTGTNTAIMARHARIKKIEGLPPDGCMAINVESGSFAKAPRSQFDIVFDATTTDTGTYAFEKMISGAYLGGLGLTALQAAARDGLFTPPTAAKLLQWQELSNKDFDDFCAAPSEGATPFQALNLCTPDIEVIVTIGNAIYQRAALLAAVNISSAIVETQKAGLTAGPVAMTIDGSTFYRTRCASFRQIIETNVAHLMEVRGIAYELLESANAPVIGAAIAALARRSQTPAGDR